MDGYADGHMDGHTTVIPTDGRTEIASDRDAMDAYHNNPVANRHGLILGQTKRYMEMRRMRLKISTRRGLRPLITSR